MNFRRKTTAFAFVFATFCLCTALKEEGIPSSHEKEKRSLLKLFSATAEPDSDKQGFTIGARVKNVLTGGSLGFHIDINPSKTIHGVLGGFAKHLVPGQKPRHPTQEKPDIPKDNGKPQPDDFQPEIPKEEIPDWEDLGELKESKGMDHVPPPSEKFEDSKKLDKPNPSGMHVDEDAFEDHDYVTIPIEDIIQPRVRTRSKRFIESKIYYVPVLYRSNAKPYRVEVATNRLRPKKVEKVDAV